MHIAILDDYQDALRSLDCFTRLQGHRIDAWRDHTDDADVLVERLADVDTLVLIRERTRLPASLLERLPKLRLISQYGETPHIDVAACSRLGIVVSSARHGRPSYATAEFTWGLIIAALRRIPQEAARLRAGGWQSTLGQGLHGKTLGIFGYGRIGALIAGYGKAFGMRVLVWGRAGTLARAQADGHQVASDKEAFFREADVVSLHLRLTPETRAIVGRADLGRMKPSALLVNTSRAALIEPDALEQALKAGRPGFAAVDVYEEEPVSKAGHPLLALDNALCTPHLGYVERDAYEFGFSHVVEQILAFGNRAPINVVNPEVLAALKAPA